MTDEIVGIIDKEVGILKENDLTWPALFCVERNKSSYVVCPSRDWVKSTFDLSDDMLDQEVADFESKHKTEVVFSEYVPQ